MSSLRGDGTRAVVIYTDGACKGNPGPGGWGALLLSGEHKREIFGGESPTTNNRMELTAVIRALEALKRVTTAQVYTDSQYVKNGITRWIKGWKRKGWLTAEKQPVKNEDLWRQLDGLTQKHEVEWRWLKGHVGHSLNEHCDSLARDAIPSSRVAPTARAVAPS